MDLFDLIVIGLIVLAAFGGYRLGFVARALSWVGLAAGIYLGARYLGDIIDDLRPSGATTRLVVAVVVLVGAALVGQAIGMLIGSRVHAVLPPGPVRGLDRVAGALAGALGVLVALWLLLPTIASVPGWPAREAADSSLAQWVSRDLPAPPVTLETLRRLVAESDFPQVFSALHPTAAAGPVPAASPLPVGVLDRVERSTVKVEGEACDRIQEGSGFAVAPDLVLTNAHVVAGEPAGSTSVRLPDGQHLRATVVLYDPDRDLALLSVPGLGEAPLSFADGHIGQVGDVLGHPGGQDALAVQPERISSRITAVGENLYDTVRTRRQVYVLAADLAPGDSGGAVVDRSGQVVGVAFAISLDAPDTAYALTASEVRPDLEAARSGRPVSTEACLDG